MPVLARVRHLFDLDAEPTLIDAHLAASGLGRLVGAHPGVRVPGTLDGFDVALRTLLRRATRSQTAYESLAWRVAAALGEPVDVRQPSLHHLPPDPRRITACGADALTSLGVRERYAVHIVELARAVLAGRVRLAPGSDRAISHASSQRSESTKRRSPGFSHARRRGPTASRRTTARAPLSSGAHWYSAPSDGGRGERMGRCTCSSTWRARRTTRRALGPGRAVLETFPAPCFGAREAAESLHCAT
jgi:hypothetical protein